MQLLIEVKGDGFQINAAFTDPNDVRRVLDIAEQREPAPGNSPMLPLLAESPALVVETPVAAKSHKKKPAEKPQEAATAIGGPGQQLDAAVTKEMNNQEAQKVQEKAANGHPEPPHDDEAEAAEKKLRKDAADACMAAIARNRGGVQALLAEFEVERFRDLGNDLVRLKQFSERLASL